MSYPVYQDTHSDGYLTSENRMPTIDEHPRVAPPSELLPDVRATRVDTVPQQASTQPGDGSEVRVEFERSKGLSGTFNSAIPFVERAVGGAQKVRGTLLRNHELKEHGQAILDGRTTHAADKLKKD